MLRKKKIMQKYESKLSKGKTLVIDALAKSSVKMEYTKNDFKEIMEGWTNEELKIGSGLMKELADHYYCWHIIKKVLLIATGIFIVCKLAGIWADGMNYGFKNGVESTLFNMQYYCEERDGELPIKITEDDGTVKWMVTKIVDEMPDSAKDENFVNVSDL